MKKKKYEMFSAWAHLTASGLKPKADQTGEGQQPTERNRIMSVIRPKLRRLHSKQTNKQTNKQLSSSLLLLQILFNPPFSPRCFPSKGMSSTGLRIFHIVNALAMFVAAVLLFIGLGFPGIPLAVYVIVFGVAILAVEFRYAKVIVNNMSFLMNWFGRGFFYVFIGLIVWFGPSAYSIPSGILFASGIICFILGFVNYASPSP